MKAFSVINLVDFPFCNLNEINLYVERLLSEFSLKASEVSYTLKTGNRAKTKRLRYSSVGKKCDLNSADCTIANYVAFGSNSEDFLANVVVLKTNHGTCNISFVMQERESEIFSDMLNTMVDCLSDKASLNIGFADELVDEKAPDLFALGILSQHLSKPEEDIARSISQNLWCAEPSLPFLFKYNIISLKKSAQELLAHLHVRIAGPFCIIDFCDDLSSNYADYFGCKEWCTFLSKATELNIIRFSKDVS